MRIKTVAGGFIALAFVAVSTVMACRFGWELGSNDIDRTVYATAGGLADVLKALLPLVAVGAWSARAYVRAALAGVVFIVFTGYSLTASFGLAAIQQAQKNGGHEVVVTSYKDLRKLVDDLTAKRSALGATRAPGALEADKAAAALDRLWTQTHECTDVTAAASRIFCQRVQALEAELATARDARDLDAKISAAQTRLEKLDLREAVTETDPQAAALSRLTGRSQELVRSGLQAALALLLELGSGLGFFLIFGHHGHTSEPDTVSRSVGRVRRQVAAAEPSVISQPGHEIERFILEQLRPIQFERVSASDLYAAYREWCLDRQSTSVSHTTFGRLVRWRKARIGGRVQYLDCALVSKPSVLNARDHLYLEARGPRQVLNGRGA
jgi:hypothetical protein